MPHLTDKPLAVRCVVCLAAIVVVFAADALAQSTAEDRAETLRRLRLRVDDLRENIAATERKLLEITKQHITAKERLTEAIATHATVKKTLDAAQVKAKQTREAETRVILELRRRAEADPRHAEAVAAVEQAQAEMERARDAVLERLREQPEHRDAVAALEAARAEVERFKQAGNRVAIVEASQRVLGADQVVAKLNRAALESDEAYTAAHQRVVVANAHLGNVRDEIDRAMKTDFLRVESHRANQEAQRQLTDAERAYRVETQRARAVEAAFKTVNAALTRTQRDLAYYQQELSDTLAALAGL